MAERHTLHSYTLLEAPARCEVRCWRGTRSHSYDVARHSQIGSVSLKMKLEMESASSSPVKTAGRTTLFSDPLISRKISGEKILFTARRWVPTSHLRIPEAPRHGLSGAPSFRYDRFHNVASGLKIRNMEKGEIRRTVLDHLDRFGITQLIDRSARTLSGGRHSEQAWPVPLRSSLKSFFWTSPLPRSISTRESLVEDLDRGSGRANHRPFLPTHDRMEALRLSDHIAVMIKANHPDRPSGRGDESADG